MTISASAVKSIYIRSRYADRRFTGTCRYHLFQEPQKSFVERPSTYEMQRNLGFEPSRRSSIANLAENEIECFCFY